MSIYIKYSKTTLPLRVKDFNTIIIQFLFCKSIPNRSSARQIGPSRVRALPLAAGIHEGGYYFRYFGPSEVRATSGAN